MSKSRKILKKIPSEEHEINSHIKNWNIDKISQHITKSIELYTNNKADGFKELVIVFTLLIEHSLNNRNQVLNLLATHTDQLQNIFESVFIDTIWIMWYNFDGNTQKQENMSHFIKELMERDILNKDKLLERLPIELIDSVKLYSGVTMKKRETTYRTQQRFAQHKFNLMREESEGYSKLITILSQSNIDLVQAVSSLVGYFDLDPNRTFDLILYIYQNHLNNSNSEDVFLKLVDLYPPIVIARVIAFQINLYDSDKIPNELFQLTAHLVFHKKCDILMLWKFLQPTDKQIIGDRKNELDKANQAVARLNVVSLSGEDKDSKKDSKEKEKKEKEASFVTAKHQLISAMIEHGAWKEARLFLENLADSFPAKIPIVSSKLCEMLHRIIDPYYESTLSKSHKHIHTHTLITSPPISEKEKAQTSATPAPSPTLDNITEDINREKETEISPMDTTPAIEIDEIKILDQSKSNITQPQPIRLTVSVKQLEWATISDKILDILQPLSQYLYRDVLLMSKLCRVLSKTLKLHYSQSVIETILSISILPAFSLIQSSSSKEKDSKEKEEKDLKCSSDISADLWMLMRLLPYQIRFKLYGHWRTLYNTIPELMIKKCEIIKQTKYFKNRLVNERGRECGRALVKFCDYTPLIVIELLLQGIQHYDNLIPALVDSLRYLTSISFDCVVFLILDQSCRPDEKLKNDGVNLADWFQSLTTFAGLCYRKYPDIELGALLQFVVCGLLDERSLDIEFLRQIIQGVSTVDIDTSDSLQESQLLDLAGPSLLRTELSIRSNLSNIVSTSSRRKSASFLISALVKNKLILPLFVLLSQQSTFIVFHTESPHIKLLGELIDRCQSCLVQFIEFVQSHSTDEQYSQLLPSLKTLTIAYHIPPEFAFLICRPVLNILSSEKKTLNLKSSLISNELVETTKSILPDMVWEAISPQFYCIFWKLTMHDLYTPKETASNIISKMEQDIKELKDKDKGDSEKDRENIQKRIEKLEDAMNNQEKNHNNVMTFFEKEKNNWLKNCSKRECTAQVFLQYCILPRCRQSALDALYCAKFVSMIHNIGTPYFLTVVFYDQVIRCVSSVMASSTANEASRFGRFLLKLFDQLHSWTISLSTYERECQSLPGAATILDSPNGSRLAHPRFVKLVSKWHNVLLRAFLSSVQSANTMTVRNALIVLDKIILSYPRTVQHSTQLETQIQYCRDTAEKGSDLKVLATRICSQLAQQIQVLNFSHNAEAFYDSEVTTLRKERAFYAQENARLNEIHQSLLQENARLQNLVNDLKNRLENLDSRFSVVENEKNRALSTVNQQIAMAEERARHSESKVIPLQQENVMLNNQLRIAKQNRDILVIVLNKLKVFLQEDFFDKAHSSVLLDFLEVNHMLNDQQNIKFPMPMGTQGTHIPVQPPPIVPAAYHPIPIQVQKQTLPSTYPGGSTVTHTSTPVMVPQPQPSPIKNKIPVQTSPLRSSTLQYGSPTYKRGECGIECPYCYQLYKMHSENGEFYNDNDTQTLFQQLDGEVYNCSNCKKAFKITLK